jgi:hypothetical protein
MKLIDEDRTLPKDMTLAIREARSLLSICLDEAEAKEILPTLKRFDAILARADAQHY